MKKQGTIYLVGTGPGEAGLITVKGLALIREADAVVGDLLGQAQLLRETKPAAEQHDVGCRASRTKISQEAVNRLLIKLAKAGKSVVRLWPGDPFVFGRAAMEIAAAQKAGLTVEVVPGVTSAIAAPAYAGVPVTHWDLNTSFAVVTGYPSKTPGVSTDWPALARIDPLVILMPLDDLAQIVATLAQHGKPVDTPALVVQHGTLPQQKQVATNLGELVEAVARHHIDHPAIVVVGKNAALAGALNWFQPDSGKPLLGKRVLVTRPAHQAGEFMAALRDLGAEPVAFPTISIEPVADNTVLDEAIIRIAQAPAAAKDAPTATGYDWLVLTSVNGVAAFWQRLAALDLDSRILSPVRIAAIGPATAAELNRRSIKPDLIPEVYTAEGVLDAFDGWGPVSGRRFLLARADIARKALAEGLTARGAIVDEIAAYRTIPVPKGPLPPPVDIVTFTSSSTVQGYVNCLGGLSPTDRLKDSLVMCIGPITAGTARDLGLPVDRVAQDYTIEGILQILEKAE